MRRMLGYISLGTGVLALLGCRQGTANPAGDMESSAGSSYASEVQKLKAGPVENLDSAVIALAARMGDPMARARTGIGARAAEAPLEKSAARMVYSMSGEVEPISRFILWFNPGDWVFLLASPIEEVSPADPQIFLIQFNHSDFIKNGTIPADQTDFRILAWDDDEGPGDLGARVAYNFKKGESGYFMLMAIPSSNFSAQKYVEFQLEVENRAFGFYHILVRPHKRKLGGMVEWIRGGHDFRADLRSDLGDPRLYVLLPTRGAGRSSGDVNSSRNSRVYPYMVTREEGVVWGNTVLIDNETEWTRAPILHTQYAP